MIGLYVLLTTGFGCPLYQCREDSIDSIDSTCVFYYENTYYVQPCSPELVCSEWDGSNSTCVEPPSMPPELAYPGEPCKTAKDCAYGLCSNATCAGLSIEEKCKITEECDVGLFCYNNQCVKLRDWTYHTCNSDFDCKNNFGCNTIRTGIAKCVEYAWKTKGEHIQNCKNYESISCDSGNCLAPGGFGHGVCVDSIKSTYIGNECEEDSDCIGEMNGYFILSKCECGYNLHGKQYCQPFLGDYYGSKYWELFREYVRGDIIHTCHTNRRFSSECMRKWEHYELYKYYYLTHKMYPLIQENDECVKSLFTSEYWDSEYSFPLDLSMNIAVSLFLLLLT